jgi:hypothetical protein
MRFDGGASLAPVGLGVGWGPMSDTGVIDELEFSPIGRCFYWRPRHAETFPAPPQTVLTHAAQVHLIPASLALAARPR